MDLVWTATAPHNPSFFKIWITKANYDHKTHLAWDKIAFLGRYDIDSDVTKVGNEYRMKATLPARSGRHVLYVAWQRIDPVGEVFFSTSDLIFRGDPDPNVLPVVSVGSVVANEGAAIASVNVILSKSVTDAIRRL